MEKTVEPAPIKAETTNTAADEIAGWVVISWFSLWLFTVGFAHLGFWKGFFAFIIWPYFFGAQLSR